MTPGAFKNSDGLRQGYSCARQALSTSYTVARLAGDLYTYRIDTATNNDTYGVNLTAPETSSITYVADGSATKAEIADGIALAWNADATCAKYAIAVSDAVDTVTFFCHTLTVTIVEDEDAAKTTLTHVTIDAGALEIPPAFRGLKLRAKLSTAVGFVPGDSTDGVVTVFLAADAAGDIPLTSLQTQTSAPGKTTPATKGGIAFSLDKVAEGNHADRTRFAIYVVAKCSTGTVSADWFLDWEDTYSKAA